MARIDKYIWTVRIFKTRSLATTACKAGRVFLNGKIVKPAKEIVPGDVVEVRKGAVHFKYSVIDSPKSRVGAKLVADYVKDITPKEELEKLKMIQLAYHDTVRRKPGRPTKKDRRDLDNFFG